MCGARARTRTCLRAHAHTYRGEPPAPFRLARRAAVHARRVAAVAGRPSRARRAKVLTPGPARPPAGRECRAHASRFEPAEAAARHACHAAATRRLLGRHRNGIRPSAYVPRSLLQARSMPSSATAGWRRTRTSYRIAALVVRTTGFCFTCAAACLSRSALRVRVRGGAAALRSSSETGSFPLAPRSQGDCAALARGPPQTAPRRPYALGPPPPRACFAPRGGPRRCARSPEGSRS